MTTRILIIDDQFAKEADIRGNLCAQCDLVKIDLETSDADLDEMAKADGAQAGAVFFSGQVGQGDSVENSIDEVMRVVERGWPSDEGWRWGLILLDLHFVSIPPRNDDDVFGLKILEELVRRWPDKEAAPGNSEIPIVMLTSIWRVKREKQANRAGAQAYVEKADLERAKLKELLDEHGLIEDPDGKLIGRSYAMLKVLREARGVARMKSGNALILGAQGVGKSTLAGYIHKQSGRKGAFVPFFSNPSVSQLEYAALFGYWIGAHSEAKESACGKAEEAHNGTLLIDEVHNLNTDIQQELLQFGRLEGGRRWLRRLGNFPTSPSSAVDQARRSLRGERDTSNSRVAVDLLLLTATNAPVDNPKWRKKHQFSEALYTRLATEYENKPLRFPDLTLRREDIPTLFESFLKQETGSINGRTNTNGTKTIDEEVKKRLLEYSWPGNVAELRGVSMATARNSRDFPDVLVRHLPPLVESKRSRPKVFPVPSPALASPPPAGRSNTLAEAEQALRNAQVPSLKDLKGSLASLEDAYGQLIKEILEAAFEQKRLAEKNPEKICLPVMRWLIGDEIDTATKAYSKFISLSKRIPEFEPGSYLDCLLKRAKQNRSPSKGSSKKDKEDS